MSEEPARSLAGREGLGLGPLGGQPEEPRDDPTGGIAVPMDSAHEVPLFAPGIGPAGNDGGGKQGVTLMTPMPMR